MAASKGLMGFGSSTGGGKPHHNIHEFKFNVYEGSDKNSPLNIRLAAKEVWHNIKKSNKLLIIFNIFFKNILKTSKFMA